MRYQRPPLHKQLRARRTLCISGPENVMNDFVDYSNTCRNGMGVTYGEALAQLLEDAKLLKKTAKTS